MGNELPWRMLYLLLAAFVIAASGQAAVAERAFGAVHGTGEPVDEDTGS